jgi:hypothetical protein
MKIIMEHEKGKWYKLLSCEAAIGRFNGYVRNDPKLLSFSEGYSEEGKILFSFKEDISDVQYLAKPEQIEYCLKEYANRIGLTHGATFVKWGSLFQVLGDLKYDFARDVLYIEKTGFLVYVRGSWVVHVKSNKSLLV